MTLELALRIWFFIGISLYFSTLVIEGWDKWGPKNMGEFLSMILLCITLWPVFAIFLMFGEGDKL